MNNKNKLTENEKNIVRNIINELVEEFRKPPQDMGIEYSIGYFTAINIILDKLVEIRKKYLR